MRQISNYFNHKGSAQGSIIKILTTSHTLEISNNNSLLLFDNTSPVTVTIPPDSVVAFPVNSRIDCSQLGTGAVTFAEGAGVTINPGSVNKTIAAQYAGVTLVKIDSDTWLLVGNLIA